MTAVIRVTISLILLAALASALGACRREGKKELPPASGPGAAPLPAMPELAPAGGGERVAPSGGKTTGTTFARAEAQIAPNAGGVLVEARFKEGDTVKKGDVLFRLDSRDAALRVKQARAALATAEVQLRAAKADYDRMKVMVEEGAMNRATWDGVEARHDGARAGVAQAQVAVEMAEKGLADTVVRSPIDGVIALKLKSVGETVTMMPPSPVYVVQDVSRLDLRFRLPEAALAQVKPGSPISARFSALGVTRAAVVARVSPSVDPRSRTVELIAELDNAAGDLRPGLLAEVELGGAGATP